MPKVPCGINFGGFLYKYLKCFFLLLVLMRCGASQVECIPQAGQVPVNDVRRFFCFCLGSARKLKSCCLGSARKLKKTVQAISFKCV